MGILWIKIFSVIIPDGVAVPDVLRTRLLRAPEHTTITLHRIEDGTFEVDEAQRDTVQSFINACGVVGRFAQPDGCGIADWVDGLDVGSGIDVTWLSRPLFERPALSGLVGAQAWRDGPGQPDSEL